MWKVWSDRSYHRVYTKSSGISGTLSPWGEFIKTYKIDGGEFITPYLSEAQELADKLNGVK